MNLIRLLFHRHKWVALYSEIYSLGIKRVCHSHDKCYKCGDVRLARIRKAFGGSYDKWSVL